VRYYTQEHNKRFKGDLDKTIMELIALLSSGKGTWGQVAGLINREKWDNVVLVTDAFFKSKVGEFDFSKNAELVVVDFNAGIKEVIIELKEKLKSRIHGIEVALTVASGSGKEHMALISALLQLPVGIKFVALTQEGIIEF
jgi:glycerol dehydrogenase-like iron-containing ADH family enzyme